MSGTAASLDQQQLQGFRERVARIERRGRKMEYAPVGAVEFDDSGEAVLGKTPSHARRKRAGQMKALLLMPFAVALALAFGAATVLTVRLARVIYDGSALTGEAAGRLMLIDAGGALAIVLLINALVRPRGRLTILGQLVGLGAGVLAMQDAVHMAPDLWLNAFPEAWVQSVLTETTPNSILIRGVSYSY